MAVVVQSYEEIRRQRIEENMKRMEQLNLHALAQKMKCSSSKPSVKPTKLRAVRNQLLEFIDVRRSTRVANKPAPDYTDAVLDCLKEAKTRVCKRRDLSGRVYASHEARSYATNRAIEFQSTLPPEFPSFVKPMLQSHVTGGFWLGLPRHFCKSHLPSRDETVTLVDEKDDEFPTVYLAQKNGLSGGWRGFSLDHNLVDGDALVFHLVKRTTLKVYIIRASDYNEK